MRDAGIQAAMPMKAVLPYSEGTVRSIAPTPTNSSRITNKSETGRIGVQGIGQLDPSALNCLTNGVDFEDGKQKRTET